MPPKSKNNRSKENSSSSLNRILIASFIGSALFFAFVSLISVVILKTNAFTTSLYMPLGLVSGAASSFLCGFMAVRPVKKNGAATGALSGLVQALICSATVFFINGNKSGIGIFVLMAVIAVFSSLGGISAVNLKAKKRY